MQLEHFPLDHQTCYIKISSCKFVVLFISDLFPSVMTSSDICVTDSYDNNSVVFQWLLNPIEINLEELELPQFELLYWECGSCQEVYRTGMINDINTTAQSYTFCFYKCIAIFTTC